MDVLVGYDTNQSTVLALPDECFGPPPGSTEDQQQQEAAKALVNMSTVSYLPYKSHPYLFAP